MAMPNDTVNRVQLFAIETTWPAYAACQDKWARLNLSVQACVTDRSSEIANKPLERGLLQVKWLRYFCKQMANFGFLQMKLILVDTKLLS